MKLLLELFWTFAKIGLFTFGGGYAMIPLIEDTCVEKKRWITHEEMMNITVIAESTPGPVSINCATFTGFRQAGFPGGLAATVGVVLPSFVVIYGLSFFLKTVLEIPAAAHAFAGMRIAVGLLIVNAAVGMIRRMELRALWVILMTCAFAVILAGEILSFHVSTVWLMLASAAVSLAVCLLRRSGTRGGRRG